MKMKLDGILSFRKVVEADRELLLIWANEAETRKQSFQTHEIMPQEHDQWFQHVLGDEMSRILILCLRGKPIGNMRFSISATSAMISYNIDYMYRGFGFGKELIKMAIDYARENLDVSFLQAETKQGNVASQKVLLKNGFLPMQTLPNQGVIVFLKTLQ